MVRTVDAARTAIAFRDDSHFHATRALPILRRALLEIGRRLADVGTPPDAAQVLRLRLEELEELGDPADLPEADAGRLRSLTR